MKSLKEIEQEFDVFFESLRYSRIDLDVGSSPTFANADYINKSNKTIVELKIINKEFFPKGGVIDSLNALILQPTNIDDKGLGQYTFELPKINREGKHDRFEEPLRRIIKKANKQIKQTKEYYDDNRFSGFVIIAQVGLTSLSTVVTAQLVRKIIQHEFSSINGAIICSPYEKNINPLTQETNPECVSVTNEANSHLRSKCVFIADSWIKFLESAGHPKTLQTK